SSTREYLPLQAICDIFTIWEKKGKLEGVKLAYVGKGGHNAASLIMGGIKCGMEIAVATPEKFQIAPEHLQRAEQYGKIFVTENPVEAVRGADVVYTDNYGYHTSLSDKDKEILKPYQVNNTLMNLAQHNALFMHALPANRGVEVTADVIDGKQSAVLDQGENKLHTIKAVLALLVK
ncbi:MAG: ornithine carbamoyltransferase, partial [Clostridia bacterium]|nr:ornithine carbamoyltransferase [Clostridia bacterium]